MTSDDKIIDCNLHFHTNVSDGSLAFLEMMFMMLSELEPRTFEGAMSGGNDDYMYVGPADHDTIQAWEAFLSPENPLKDVVDSTGDGFFTLKTGRPIKVYQNMELTMHYPENNQHIHAIALGIRPPPRDIRMRLATISRFRSDRAYTLCQSLNEKKDGKYNGVFVPARRADMTPRDNVCLEEVIGHSVSPSRLHLGAALWINGYGDSARECNKYYVTDELDGYVFDNNLLPSIDEAKIWVEEKMKGVFIMAHVFKTMDKLKIDSNEQIPFLLEFMQAYGFRGAEAQSLEEYERLTGAFKGKDYIVTIGGDNHGAYDRRGSPNLFQMPYSFIRRIEELLVDIKK